MHDLEELRLEKPGAYFRYAFADLDAITLVWACARSLRYSHPCS